VPRRSQLGSWVTKQRHNYKKGLIKKERCDQLEEIGFQWTVGRTTEWTEMFKRLQTYRQENNGSCNVPNRYKQDPQLGNWVSKQRQNYKKGLITKERCDQLEAIGFQWTLNDEQSVQELWNEMFKSLQTYQQENNGSCHVPRRYEQNPQLGNWVSKQRQNYKKGLITKERCDKLEGIGFEWTTQHGQPFDDQQWTKMFNRLQSYQQEHDGSCHVPSQYDPDPQLSNWVRKQRLNYKKGLLAKGRCDLLEAMGFQWTLSGAPESTRLQSPLSTETQEPRRSGWI